MLRDKKDKILEVIQLYSYKGKHKVLTQDQLIEVLEYEKSKTK